MIDTTMTLPDGRSLAYTDCGAPDGPLVVYFHGAPTSRLDLIGLEESFSALGVRVVSPDRPGYGRSSPQPGRVPIGAGTKSRGQDKSRARSYAFAVLVALTLIV